MYWQFGDHLRANGQSLKYHHINQQFGGVSMSLIEWMAVPSLVPIPSHETRVRCDRQRENLKINYYQKAGLIR